MTFNQYTATHSIKEKHTEKEEKPKHALEKREHTCCS